MKLCWCYEALKMSFTIARNFAVLFNFHLLLFFDIFMREKTHSCSSGGKIKIEENTLAL